MNLHIPKPCHEDWDQMTPNEQGSFCSKCCKTVVDFTTKTADEIKNYFQEKVGQKTCGRFRGDQLSQPQHSPLFNFRMRRFAAALWLVFGTLLFTSCQKNSRPVNPRPNVVGELGMTIQAPTGAMSASNVADSPVMVRPLMGDTTIVEEPLIMKGEVAPRHPIVTPPKKVTPQKATPKKQNHEPKEFMKGDVKID